MSVMSVEGRQLELENCESSFVEERELGPEKGKEAKLEKVHFQAGDTVVEPGSAASRWMSDKRGWGDVVFDQEETGGQGFQRLGSALRRWKL